MDKEVLLVILAKFLVQQFQDDPSWTTEWFTDNDYAFDEVYHDVTNILKPD